MDPKAVATFIDAVHQFSSYKPVIRIGTRSSVLALVQAKHALRLLTRAFPATRFRVVEMSSIADDKQNVDLDKFKTTGVFTDALERALMANQIDLIVHSLKDVPSTINADTCLPAISARVDPRDAVVMGSHNSSLRHLSELPADAVIGTSSARRRALLQRQFPGFTFKPVRGNVKTRLRKLDDYKAHGYDALILAGAGLQRLHMQSRITYYMGPEESPYAIGQGALGIQCRNPGALEGVDPALDAEVIRMCREAIGDPDTTLRCLGERAFLRGLGGGCSLPIGVQSTLVAAVGEGKAPTLELRGVVLSFDGSDLLEAVVRGEVAGEDAACALGTALCEQLKGKGAATLLETMRSAASGAGK